MFSSLLDPAVLGTFIAGALSEFDGPVSMQVDDFVRDRLYVPCGFPEELRFELLDCGSIALELRVSHLAIKLTHRQGLLPQKSNSR